MSVRMTDYEGVETVVGTLGIFPSSLCEVELCVCVYIFAGNEHEREDM